MKKLTVMLLIAAMVLGVSACGNSANKENAATKIAVLPGTRILLR